ncbi:AidA/PixA family protein [Pseudomonas sp. Marseille-P9899]|uniref:AidA/PixA family protein n=1 Tax=Pseudomonas sp. Marseille-P9899 TaxID=2730401 RepID=UPI00158ABE7D|nr:AidA/PixA family protein [Pseudomonas sp. Marseille-P9899]
MSGTTQTVDVLLLVNADRLIANPNDVLGSVSLVVSTDLVDKAATGNQLDGGNELWFDVKRNDNIRWRATTLSRNFDTTALITKVAQGRAQPGYDGAISTPGFLTVEGVPVAYLVSNNPISVDGNTVTNTEWQATATKVGKIWYTIEFVLLDQELKQIGGTHTWDPYITITN